ncbi:hypothetical protein EI555_004719, partial [Monodon monoceros]
PSPIYGGLGLIVGGAVGCGIVFSFGGSFLGLIVFLIYLGGMLVVFGYTTAMATEQYPESEKVDIVFELNGLGDWVIYDTGDLGFFSEEAIGIAALYSYGWSLFIGVVVMEITR